MKLRKQVKNLVSVFNPKSMAIIGAAREPNKIGHVILRNFIEGGFAGKVYAVNPNADEILGMPTFKSAAAIPEGVDSAVIAVPAKYVPQAMQDCADAGVKGAVVITGGFSEVGEKAPELKIKKIADDNDIAMIGPNCMGVLNPSARVDSVFLPVYKLGRPRVGAISFISQSGAVGGCIMDLAARAMIGMSLFVSYGNATCINETDLLHYLSSHKETEVIVSYLEGVKDGAAYREALGSLTKNKPVVVLKAGKSKSGIAAAVSHTGSLAGSADVYSAVFKQCHATEAETLDDLFDYAKIFEQVKACGRRIAIVTNGGGNGVLAADSVDAEGLELAKFLPATTKALENMLPSTARVHNPLDLIGDADSARYDKALAAVAKDPNVDAIVVIVLFQTIALDSSVVNVIVKAAQSCKKPVVVVSTGGEYTEMHRRILDSYGIPTYQSPSSAVRSLKKLIEYSDYYSAFHDIGCAMPNLPAENE